MKTIHAMVLVVVLIVSSIHEVGAQLSQIEPKKTPIPYAQGIEWQFCVTPQNISVGQSGTMQLTLTNATTNSIIVDSDIFGYFSVLIKESQQHLPLAPVASAKAPDKQTIQAGKSIFMRYPVYTSTPHDNRLGILLARKGVYTFELLNRGNVITNVSVEVK